MKKKKKCRITEKSKQIDFFLHSMPKRNEIKEFQRISKKNKNKINKLAK